MSIRSCLFFAVLALCSLKTADAQFVTPSPEHEVLKKDVGTWEATTKMWMGPDGSPDPSAEPSVSKGTEVNRMLGDFWLISTFKGDFGGMAFEGHSTMGYDPQKKAFVGSWTDSVSPYAMHMTGSYDASTETMTLKSKGIGMDGKETTGKMTVKYSADGRVMTMYDIVDGKEIKTMEVSYKKVKE